MIEYLRRNRGHVLRFLISGGIAAGINLAAVVILIEIFRMSTLVLQNIANLIAMEISVLAQFALSRHFAWADRMRHTGGKLLRQILLFHGAVAASLILRALLFPVLQPFLPYQLNVVIGIGLGAGINFFVYNHVVFRQVGAADE